jgi:hypothetical protein
MVASNPSKLNPKSENVTPRKPFAIPNTITVTVKNGIRINRDKPPSIGTHLPTLNETLAAIIPI